MYSPYGHIYLIRLSSDKEIFYKIGITKHRYCRFYEIMKSGYSVEIVYMAMGFDYLKALYTEQYLHTLFEQYTPQTRFGGHMECFLGVDVDLFSSVILDRIGAAREYVKNLPITWR